MLAWFVVVGRCQWYVQLGAVYAGCLRTKSMPMAYPLQSGEASRCAKGIVDKKSLKNRVTKTRYRTMIFPDFDGLLRK